MSQTISKFIWENVKKAEELCCLIPDAEFHVAIRSADVVWFMVFVIWWYVTQCGIHLPISLGKYADLDDEIWMILANCGDDYVRISLPTFA